MMPDSFPFTIGLRVLCESGAIEASLSLGSEEEISLVRYSPTGEPEAISLAGGDPYTNECEFFVRCLQGDADPAMVSPEGERDALYVALAAQQAIQQGRSITLTDGAGRGIHR